MEEDYFAKKMKGVKPIKKSDNYLKKTKINKSYKLQKKINTNEETTHHKESNVNTNISEYKISFSEINKDLKKGRIKIDKRIDLHGFSLLDAKDMFNHTVHNCYKKNMRCILVITGKGVHKNVLDANQENQSPKLYYGKIKNEIISWINDQSLQKYILTYQNAGIEHGGDGAIFIYLRKKKA
tara:strand:- start:268 stop:813 length:546 start_codon:yes stop_codon:yes gene_type:complete